MSDCIFCKIVAGEISADKLLEDDQLLAFRDINPVAPNHVLIIPKRHLASLNDVGPGDEALLGHLLSTGAAVAQMEGIAQSGYRQVINCGKEAGQEVFHLHLHIIGGRAMGKMG